MNISVVNRTTTVSDGELKIVMDAIQHQLTRDFTPVWGTAATLLLVGAREQPAPGTWQNFIVDKPDVVNALGYHRTTLQGLPVGYTSIDADIQAGLEWSSTLSHEIMEMIVDPFVFSLTQMFDGRYVWLEVADAVEAISYPIKLGRWTTMVSDFQYPAWFGSPRTSEMAKFTHTGAVKAPFTLTPGGYMGVIQTDGSYIQITERRHPMQTEYKEDPPKFSRRWRRYEYYDKGMRDYHRREDAITHRVSPHISASDLK